ncbi:MAG: SDR family oxidoreductase [Alphaproteobacteria bacterium]|jgi:3-oxoacyl-[acyl-carrier protein] reductase|nr:SDR family oxidoreductase [Alphaproteobacteria bacterium]MDP6814403.1 SDR family oxidoreductase [Alphaproteobacteria bacterium]
MSNILDLQDRVALVSGAGQGIGRAIALAFAENGAKAVVINDFFADRAEATAAAVREAGCEALAVSCDVTDLAAVKAMATEGEAAFGQIDILVNNAGNAGPADPDRTRRPFWETEPEDWARWIDTNLYGVLNCTRATVGGMVERGFGRVVTIISDAGRVGEPHLVPYSAAKGGAASFTRALAKATAKQGVTVNNVAIGAVDTDALKNVKANPEMFAKMVRVYPVGRIGQPNEVANMVLFLCSGAGEWITGQTYPVNGGYSFAV